MIIMIAFLTFVDMQIVVTIVLLKVKYGCLSWQNKVLFLMQYYFDFSIEIISDEKTLMVEELGFISHFSDSLNGRKDIIETFLALQ